NTTNEKAPIGRSGMPRTGFLLGRTPRVPRRGEEFCWILASGLSMRGLRGAAVWDPSAFSATHYRPSGQPGCQTSRLTRGFASPPHGGFAFGLKEVPGFGARFFNSRARPCSFPKHLIQNG